MSDLKRGTPTRGASVLAALIVLGIFGAAFAVMNLATPPQSLTTTVVHPENKVVAAALAAGSISQVAAADEPVVDVALPARSTVSRLAPMDGFDNMLLLYYVGGQPRPLQMYVGVCPTVASVRQVNQLTRNNLPENYTQPAWFTQWVAQWGDKYPKQPNDFGKPTDARCITDTGGVRRPKPSPAVWQRWTFWCQQKRPTGVVDTAPRRDAPIQQVSLVSEDDLTQFASSVGRDATNFECEFVQGNNRPASIAMPIATTADTRDLARRLAEARTPDEHARIIADARAAGIDQSVLNSALTENRTQITTDIQDRTATLRTTEAELQRLAGRGVSEEACQNPVPGVPSDDLRAAAILAAAPSVSDCRRFETLTTEQQRLKDEIAERNARLRNLASVLQPTARPDDPAARTPPYTPPPGTINGTTFTNNGMTNGQQCQGYICQGNTLYYRSQMLVSQNPIIVQCSMQPVQQCQFGCAQPFGATGATGGIGSIMQYLPLVTSMMSMFSGGQNTNMNAMSTIGQSTQCSPTPQQQGQPQQQNPNGTGTNGQPCSQPQPPQPDPASCTSGSWQPQAAQGNGCVTGWQCVPKQNAPAGAPKANLSCQPKTADVGMSIAITYACDNTTDASADGFATNGYSGTTTATVQTPSNGGTSVTYSLTCKNAQGLTSSAQCKVDIVKPLIVLVANPKVVKNGEATSLGWITTGMQSCKIANADFKDWTAQQANNTNVNGALQSPPLTKNTLFVLDCNSIGGQTKEATVQVNVQ